MQEILPCVPPHYDAMDMFIHAFEDQMLPRLDELLEDIGLLRVIISITFLRFFGVD